MCWFVINYWSLKSFLINHSPTRFFNLIFHSLEDVAIYHYTQLHVAENYSYLSNLRQNGCNSYWLYMYFISQKLKFDIIKSIENKKSCPQWLMLSINDNVSFLFRLKTELERRDVEHEEALTILTIKHSGEMKSIQEHLAELDSRRLDAENVCRELREQVSAIRQDSTRDQQEALDALQQRFHREKVDLEEECHKLLIEVESVSYDNWLFCTYLNFAVINPCSTDLFNSNFQFYVNFTISV